MKGKSFNLGMGTLLIGLKGLALMLAPGKMQAQAQSDSADVTLDHAVTLGQKVLQPGNYKIEQLNIAGGDAPVLVFRTEDRAKVETMTE